MQASFSHAHKNLLFRPIKKTDQFNIYLSQSQVSSPNEDVSLVKASPKSIETDPGSLTSRQSQSKVKVFKM